MVIDETVARIKKLSTEDLVSRIARLEARLARVEHWPQDDTLITQETALRALMLDEIERRADH